MDGATKRTAEKLRAGVDFEQWKKNMEYIGQKKREGRITNLAFNFVVQRDNYFEMPEYIKMIKTYNADQIKFSPVTNWGNWSKSEFCNVSMLDENGEMKPELQKIVNDDIFKDDSIHLFTWVDW
jgi:hypothetical protein